MIERIRARLHRDTGGVAIFALVVLSLLYFFDEFDTAAFGVLAPDIQRAFHLSDERFGGLVILNVSLLLLLAIPVGHLADRVRRSRLVVLSGVIAGVFSFGTGLAGSVAILTVMRFGNGVGLLANGPVHNSLLADYYPVENRPTVFGTHLNALYLGAIAGPVFAGVLGSAFGWRAPFLVLIVPILATTYFARRLHEPQRGGTDDPAGAASTADAPAPGSFRDGTRALWSVRTLRRQFVASLFTGAGLLPLAFYVPLYLDRVYHLAPLARGAVGAANAAATFYGIQRSGRWTSAWFANGMGEPLRRSAYCLMMIGVGISVFAASPFLVLAFAVGLFNNFVIGVFQPPFYSVQALVSPARARTLSFSFGALFLVIGVVFLFYGVGAGAISDNHGIRWGMFVLGPYWLLGGIVLATASKFVADDAAAALRALAASADMRRRAEEGTGPILAVRDLDVSYDQTQVLFGVSLDVEEGEIVALLGTNGAGKSTLLKAISGLVGAQQGSVYFDGHEIRGADPGAIAHLGIAQVPGGRGIFPSLTVAENLRAAGWLYRGDKPYLASATQRVIEYFPILETRWDTPAGSLSGGEQQMLSLAQAFIAKPRLLMIDELSLGLAPTIVDRLLDIVRAIHDNGTTILLVEQSVNVALRLARRAVFMEKGEIRFSGPTSELLGRPDILRAVFLKGAAQNGAVNGSGSSRRPTAAAANRRAAALRKGPVVLETRGLTKRYGGVTAVSDVDLELHAGEILGLIGPNGAGKTTIFDMISGFTKADGGRVILGDADITDWPAWRRAGAGLARGFQDARLWPSLTVREALAAAIGSAVTSPLPAFLGLPAAKDAEDALAAQAEELIGLLGLSAFRDKFVAELSTGTRRMVEIATLLPNSPKVIILDEPSSGIAQKETEALGPMLREVQRYTECSILIIEHDMPLISGLADHIVALELGQVIADGRPDAVLDDARVVESYLGNTTYAELGATKAKRR
ncbi:MAG TPA: MFS transporter [Acidimicrobiales bacterium]|nr:MFS transporter [Acidimicrobiales bacterium]